MTRRKTRPRRHQRLSSIPFSKNDPTIVSKCYDPSISYCRQFRCRNTSRMIINLCNVDQVLCTRSLPAAVFHSLNFEQTSSNSSHDNVHSSSISTLLLGLASASQCCISCVERGVVVSHVVGQCITLERAVDVLFQAGHAYVLCLSFCFTC